MTWNEWYKDISKMSILSNHVCKQSFLNTYSLVLKHMTGNIYHREKIAFQMLYDSLGENNYVIHGFFLKKNISVHHVLKCQWISCK